MIDATKIEVLRKEVRQCAVELEEAAKIIAGRGLPSAATLFQTASERALKNLDLTQ